MPVTDCTLFLATDRKGSGENMAKPMDNMARTSNDDHRKMLEAIRKRDVPRVESLVSEHILRGQKIVLQALEKRPRDF